MKLMRNKRTGRTAVYDQALIDSGNWEPDEPQAETVKAPKNKSSKDVVAVSDKVEVVVQGAADESIEHQA